MTAGPRARSPRPVALIAALSGWPVYPAMLGGAAVLAAYGATYVDLSALWRPLIVMVALGLAIPGVGGLVARRWHASVVARDPDALIVVFSDHGSRLDLEDGPEWLHNLFAARTPGRESVFSQSDTPTSMFAAIFNAYFDADVVVEQPLR